MRNDVTSAYGKRGEYASELVGAGAQDLMPMLAGQALQPWAPRGLRSYAVGGSAAVGGGIANPATLPAILAALSPRVVGSGAHRAGQANRLLRSEMLAYVPPGAPRQASFQAGRAC